MVFSENRGCQARITNERKLHQSPEMEFLFSDRDFKRQDHMVESFGARAAPIVVVHDDQGWADLPFRSVRRSPVVRLSGIGSSFIILMIFEFA
jgi:hypothetical protein